MVNIPCKLLCSYKYYIDNTFNYSINIRYKPESHKNMFTKCVARKLPWQLATARSYALRMRRMLTPMFHRQEVWLTFSTVKFHHVALRQIVRESLFPPPPHQSGATASRSEETVRRRQIDSYPAFISGVLANDVLSL